MYIHVHLCHGHSQTCMSLDIQAYTVCVCVCVCVCNYVLKKANMWVFVLQCQLSFFCKHHRRAKIPGCSPASAVYSTVQEQSWDVSCEYSVIMWNWHTHSLSLSLACTHTHTHTHICTRAHSHSHTYTCTHAHTHTHTYKHNYNHMRKMCIRIIDARTQLPVIYTRQFPCDHKVRSYSLLYKTLDVPRN